jgi:hypothetical protein
VGLATRYRGNGKNSQKVPRSDGVQRKQLEFLHVHRRHKLWLFKRYNTTLICFYSIKKRQSLILYLINIGVNLPFMVQPTTYDYDAPLSEAGDVTSKFMAIRDAVSQYLPLPDFPVPSNSTKVGYGRVQMKYVSIFFK